MVSDAKNCIIYFYVSFSSTRNNYASQLIKLEDIKIKVIKIKVIKSNKKNLFNLNNKVYYKIMIIQKFQTNLIFKRSCLYFLKIYKKFSII